MRLSASAPGRIDLFNTHQDYKGLPVVPAAIDLRTCVSGEKNKTNEVIVYSAQVAGEKARDRFSIDELSFTGGWSDYLKACVGVLLGHGHGIGGGSLEIRSTIPIAAGMGGSAALEVSALAWFSHAYDLNLSRKEIAEFAYEAEHDVLGIPCGRLDQYASSYGWITKVNTQPPYEVEELPIRELVFVGVDSGIEKITARVHPQRQAEINEGLRILMELKEVPPELKKKLGYSYFEPKWDQLGESELSPYFDSIPENSAKRIRFTLRMNRSTEIALRLLRGEADVDLDRFPSDQRKRAKELIDSGETLGLMGLIMNTQHELLRDLNDVSLPQLERLREAMLEAEAMGVKLSGAGLGGSLVALVRDERQGERVLRSALSAGARRGWVLRLDQGVRS